MEDLRRRLAAKLKSARLEADLKQDQVAKYLKVTTSAISMMESGHQKVDAAELFYLSKLYGKSLVWFFDEDYPGISGQNSRWYDNDPLVREVILLMGKSSPELRRKTAYGILGFLSDR